MYPRASCQSSAPSFVGPRSSICSRVAGRHATGPGVEPSRCHECGTTTFDGQCGDGDEHRDAWFCTACWEKWEDFHSGGRGNREEEDGPRELIELWLTSDESLVVSLGTWCGVKKAMRAMSIGGPSLPFDWLRISLEGVIHMLRFDFAGFFDYFYVTHDRHFLCAAHSFFHDNLANEKVRKRYERRIERFRKLHARAETCRPSLFVYALSSTIELLQVDELFELLQELFGAKARLLLLLSSQPADITIFFEGRPGLMMSTLSTHHGVTEYSILETPYVTAYHSPLMAALQHARGGAKPYPNILVPSAFDLVQRALEFDVGCPIKHICLGEDLTTSMSHDPVLPSDEAFRCALKPSWTSNRDIMWNACKTHFARVGEVRLPEESQDQSRRAVRRWRVAFAAKMFVDKALVLPPAQSLQVDLPSSMKTMKSGTVASNLDSDASLWNVAE